MTALAFLAVYLVLPVTAGQLALREFARRGGRPIPTWHHSRYVARRALAASRRSRWNDTWRSVMAGYVERLEGMTSHGS